MRIRVRMAPNFPFAWLGTYFINFAGTYTKSCPDSGGRIVSSERCWHEGKHPARISLTLRVYYASRPALQVCSRVDSRPVDARNSSSSRWQSRNASCADLRNSNDDITVAESAGMRLQAIMERDNATHHSDILMSKSVDSLTYIEHTMRKNCKLTTQN